MCVSTLAAMLSSENVLKKAYDQLLQFGGTPHGKEEKLKILIQDITQPIINSAEHKTPSDFYNENYTIRTPDYQIRGKAMAFARKILHEQRAKLCDFSKENAEELHGAEGKNEEILEGVVEVMCSTVTELCADYFCQIYKEEQRKTTQVLERKELSHL